MWTVTIFIFSTFIILSSQRTLSEWDDIENDKNSPNVRSFIDFESELKNSECQCNWRLLRHYEAKGCEPADLDACGCPLKYDCPNINEIEENDKACHYKGKDYAPGSSINTTNPCESCRCTRGPQARIICSSIECLNLQKPLEPGCHYLYEENQCCPIRVICDHYDTPIESHQQEQSSSNCEYEGNIYPLGARMVSATDPCETCICTEGWNSNNKSCYQQDCVLEKYKAKLMDGCVPIYNELTCCPVEFYCAPDDMFLPESKEAETKAEKADSMCIFGGKHYELGKSLSINQESACITCTCQVPPDFTCLHQRCSPNPSEQYCYPYFTSDDCCPKYDCMYGDENPHNSSEEFAERELEDEREIETDNPCLEISCTEGRICMLYQVLCNNVSCPPLPTCMKTNTSCPTPQCDTGCVVTDQDENKCPTCVCGEEIEKRAASMVRCATPKCNGKNCVLIADEGNCPVCSCSEACEIPICRPGCNVISEVDGCSKCVCEDENEGCPTPLCAHSGCRIVNGSSGCPTCVCDNGSSENNRELEMEGSNQDSITDNHQQQQQQQQQDLDNLPRESSIEISNSNDYDDEISVMSRRSAQTKLNMESAFNSNRELMESRENLSKKDSSIAGSRFNKVLHKERNHEP